MINKKEMKFKEFDVYQSYYCGLCRVLKDKYGVTGQLTLSYDMTFLVLLLTALYEPEDKSASIRCIANPFIKHNYNYNDYTEYVADMNILLTYYKCEDDWLDEGKVLKKIFALLLQGKNKKISHLYNEKIPLIINCLDEIKKAEGNNESNIDLLSGYFGTIMSEIFYVHNDCFKDSLKKIGYYISKFIYIIDAYDDMEEDQKKNQFNPLLDYKEREHFHEWVKESLMMIAAEAANEFEKLPILYNVEILRNILYSGIWTRFNIVYTKEKNNERSL